MIRLTPASGDNSELISRALAADDVTLEGERTFRCASPLVIPPGRVLKSESKAYVLFSGSSKVWCTLSSGCTIERVDITAVDSANDWTGIVFGVNIDDVSLRQVTISGPCDSAAAKGLQCVSLWNAKRLRAVDMCVSGSTGGLYGIEIIGGNDLLFDRVQSCNNSADGIKIFGNADYGLPKHVRLMYPTCSGNGTAVPLGRKTNGEGIDIGAGFGHAIVGAVCEDNYGPGIQIKPANIPNSECYGITISDAKLCRNTNGFGIVQNSGGAFVPHDIVLNNVLCDSNTENGFAFTTGKIDRVIGSNLVASNNGGIGMTLQDGTADFLLDNVVLRGNGTKGNGWNMAAVNPRGHMIERVLVDGKGVCQGIYMEGKQSGCRLSDFALRDHLGGLDVAYYSSPGVAGHPEDWAEMWRS